MKTYRRRRVAQSFSSTPDLLVKHLAPLKMGKPVRLAIDQTKQSGKKTRETKLLMLLAPGALYQMQPDLIIVSVIDKGSCIIDPKAGKGIGSLGKAGVPVRLAIVLLDKLKELYGERNAKNTP
jgi:hypothetical protein